MLRPMPRAPPVTMIFFDLVHGMVSGRLLILSHVDDVLISGCPALARRSVSEVIAKNNRNQIKSYVDAIKPLEQSQISM